MRLKIHHETRYSYTEFQRGITQMLRLTPRNHYSQYIVDWRIDIDSNCRLYPAEDAFGNIIHTFTIQDPVESLAIIVEGEVETQDTHGILQGTVERFPTALYLRETELTARTPEMTAFAKEIAERTGGSALDIFHALLKMLYTSFTFDTGATHAQTTAAEAFANRHGVCQDYTHIFIALARSLGYPARYVSGYFFRVDGRNDQDASHAWVEIHIPDLGWVGFDPANGIATTDAHVRVAIGLDYLGAAPVRGSRVGTGREILDVRVLITPM